MDFNGDKTNALYFVYQTRVIIIILDICIKLLFNANKENSTYRLNMTILLRLLNFVHNISRLQI